MRIRMIGLVAAVTTVTATTVGVAAAEVAPGDAVAAGFDFGSPEVAADGLDLPWGLDFLPDGAALFTQRDAAQIMRLESGGEPEVVATLDGVEPGGDGEGGLLGLAVSPDYDSDHLVYVYYSTAEDNRVARLTLDSPEPEVILDDIPRATYHNGGRVEFGPDGKLYVTTGDAKNGDNAQDSDSLGGKILRLEPDGAIPSDNPFGADSPVWTMGHRNVQGLDWTADGRAFASELGENTWDEVNEINPGDNYGWPEAEGPSDNPDFVDPIATWPTSDCSPSGAAIVDDILYVGALRGERLWMVPWGGGDPQSVLDGEFGRIRTVEHGPDGWLWVTTSNRDGDQVLRFPPR